MELFLGTENVIDSRPSKPDAQDSVDNLIITRIFQIGFGQQVLTNIQIFNSGRMAAPCGTRKRLREIFAISLGAARSSLHRSISATRETRHVASRWRAVSVCVDLVHQQLSPRRRLPPSLLVLDETNCGCSTTSQLRGESGKALLVDTITTTRSHRLVVKPEARGGG